LVTRGWRWRRRLRWFAGEFLVVAGGVLVALALNAWWQGQQERQSETQYLSALRQDIQTVLLDGDQARAFHADQAAEGIEAYRALSTPLSRDEQREVSHILSSLGERRTAVLADDTYQDLLSTGNLRLIRDRGLREQIVSFFHGAGATYGFVNRNNAAFVDDMYMRNVVASGLVLYRSSGRGRAAAVAVDSRMAEFLAELDSGPLDRLWSHSEDAPEWEIMRSNLLLRIRVAALAGLFFEEVLADAERLAATLDAELAVR